MSKLDAINEMKRQVNDAYFRLGRITNDCAAAEAHYKALVTKQAEAANEYNTKNSQLGRMEDEYKNEQDRGVGEVAK